MTTKINEWLNWPAGVPDAPGAILVVSDGCLSHCRPLMDGETIPAALGDYARDYESDTPKITVDWTLYRDGVEAESGRCTLRVGRR